MPSAELGGGLSMKFAYKFSPVLFALGALCFGLLMLSGCSNDSKHAASKPDSATLRSVADNNNELPSASVPAAPSASSRLTVRQARSQAEIEDAYRIPALSVQRTSDSPRPLRTEYNPAENEAIIRAEPGWDVQVTREWRHIVVHHSASAVGSAAIFDKAHRERGWDGLGYHFVIGNGSASGDGEVEVGYRWKRQQAGAHAGNAEYNQAGIGICLVGDFEHGDSRPSAAQMASLRRLVRFLQVKTGVPTSEICGHENVPGKSTQCPGKNFNLAAFRSSLGNGAIGIPYQMARDTSPSPASSPVRLARGVRGGASLP